MPYIHIFLIEMTYGIIIISAYIYIIIYKTISENTFFIKNLIPQNYNKSVFIVKKIILDMNLLFSQFIVNQNVYQISCMCQHKLNLRRKVLRFQRISAKHLNVKNQINQYLH